MSDETLYTIGELAEAAGVTPRTIRYYTAEGLLPSPDTRGRYALYGADHLNRLLLIARLKDAYLPLGEIKAQMERLSAKQVGQLLIDYVEQIAPPGSAADYIAQVLSTSVATPAPPPAGPRMLAESAPGYTAASEQASAGTTPIGFAAPQPAAPTHEALPAPPAAAPARGGLLKRFVPQRRDTTWQTAATEETWRRVGLAPGVELHVREPLPAEVRERVARLIARARELFGNNG
jgi:DNA-binding transcriptional MerR regulator